MNESGDKPGMEETASDITAAKTSIEPPRLPYARTCLIISLLAIVAVCSTVVIVWWKSMETIKDLAAGIQIPFLEANIQETFQNTAFTVSGNEGGILEVATAQATETFERKSEVSLFDRTLPLGTTISEIQIPAVYRYHIDLNGNWQITSKLNKCIVLAPEILPTLPVAFDTGKMKTKTASGWARWDKHENLKVLEKSLTEKLATKASLPDNIDKVRDEARISIAKFVKNWLIHQKHWSQQRFTEIIVIFPDELKEAELMPNLPLPSATLRLDDAPSPSLPDNSL